MKCQNSCRSRKQHSGKIREELFLAAISHSEMTVGSLNLVPIQYSHANVTGEIHLWSLAPNACTSCLFYSHSCFISTQEPYVWAENTTGSWCSYEHPLLVTRAELSSSCFVIICHLHSEIICSKILKGKNK